jgi:hypothetical protein
MRYYIFLLVSVLCVTGCGEFAPQVERKKKQTTAEKLKPTPENTLEQLMEKSGHNINYILYGMLNYDQVKIKRGTKNIMTLCRLMMQKLPDYVLDDQEEKERWEVAYREQSQIAENLNYRFEELNYESTRVELKMLLKNCMLCHEDIGEMPIADVTFYGPKVPTMDHSLTKVMDSDNVNFDLLLFGLVANDQSESESAITNIKRTSSLMIHKIPSQFQAQKEKWDLYCKRQRESATRISESIKSGKTDELWDNVQALLKDCMDCHKLYKPGIK